MYERLIQKLINRKVGAIAGTLRPTRGETWCTVETGKFSNTYDGYTATSCCFRRPDSCVSMWYWDTPVNVTKFNILSLYFYPNSSIIVILGVVNGSWKELWRGVWKPNHNTWDSKVISCNNCTGIGIATDIVVQPSRPCIVDVTVDVEGKATITSISKPDTFTPGVTFKMTTRARNDGGSDNLFIQLVDTDTGDIIKKYTSPGLIPPGGEHAYTMVITLTQTTDFYGRIEAGHIE